MIFTKQSHTIAFALCIIAAAVIMVDPGTTPISQARQDGAAAGAATASLAGTGRATAAEGVGAVPQQGDPAPDAPVDEEWYAAPSLPEPASQEAATPPPPAAPPADAMPAPSHGPGPPPPGVT